MSYLECEKCGGQYKLKEGESPDDFTSCECGGNLKYVQNFNMHFDEELDPLNELTTCPNCGAEILSTQKFCKSCSNIEKNKKNLHDSTKKDLKESKNKKVIITLMGIIAGILIVLIPNFLIVNQNYALFLIVIGGLAASLIAGRNNEERALNGILIGLIAGLILLIFRSNIIISSKTPYFYGFIFEMAGPLLILTLFGLIGGLIDISIRYLILRSQNRT
jgi:hypothetical protein